MLALSTTLGSPFASKAGIASSLLLLLITVLKLWVVCAGVQPYEQIWPPSGDEAGLLLWLEVQCSRLWQEAVRCGTFPLDLPV